MSLNQSRSMFGFSYETASQPAEGYVSPTEKIMFRQISDANQKVAKIPVGRTEAIRWKSVDGLEIEGLLTYPVGYQPGHRYPLLLCIHGGPIDVFVQAFEGSPYDNNSIFAAGVLASRGYAVLSPNPRGSGGYGAKFRAAVFGDIGGGDFQDLMTGVDHVIGLGIADPDRLGVLGFSYGGYLAAWTITHTKRFRAASIGAAEINLVSDSGTAEVEWVAALVGGELWEKFDDYIARSPIAHVKGVSTPTLIQTDEKDGYSLTQGYAFYHALKRQGCPVKMVVYPRSSDEAPDEPKLLLDWMRRNVEWMDKYVLGVGP